MSNYPFDLGNLREPLSKVPRELVSAARAWFDEDDRLFTDRGGQLLKGIFPDLSWEFEQVLLERVRTGDATNLQFVTRILNAYDGQSFLHGICKEIVAALDPDDPLLMKVKSVLDATGTVLGEFGMVAAYEQKIVEIEAWRTDPRERVCAFADWHIRSLERQAAAERRRSEESLELRRREYDGDAAGEAKGDD